MRAPGDHRFIAASDLMLALSAGLDASEAVIDRPADRLVIAELEMEERHFLAAAPVTAEKGVLADEIERPGDRPPAAAGEEQQDRIAQPLADEIEQAPGEIGPAPFARAGVLVEVPHRVPLGGADLTPAQGPDIEPLERR